MELKATFNDELLAEHRVDYVGEKHREREVGTQLNQSLPSATWPFNFSTHNRTWS